MPEVVAAYLRTLLAPNPGPMTLDGTNTWILGDPSAAAPVVVDPGPSDVSHLTAVFDACGGRVAEILLTHHHHDHSDGASWLADRAGCPVRAADPALVPGAWPLADQETVAVVGATLTAYATPGHTADSVSFLLRGDDGVAWLLTGDMVLGRGTTVIMHPDGDLAAYFGSLTTFDLLVDTAHVAEILPGHGPRRARPAELLAHYRRHRLERLSQVRAALAAGDRTPAEVVRRVYADVDRSVWPAAEQSVQAQIQFLDS